MKRSRPQSRGESTENVFIGNGGEIETNCGEGQSRVQNTRPGLVYCIFSVCCRFPQEAWECLSVLSHIIMAFSYIIFLSKTAEIKYFLS